MKKIILAIGLWLLPTLAFAQCSGVFPASSVCGTGVGGPAVPGVIPLSSLVVPQNLIPGSTVITGGTSNGVLYNTGGVLGNTSATNSAVLITNTSGVPFLSLALPTGFAATNMVLTTPALTGAAINMTAGTITNLVTPTNPGDAASKSYVDSVAGAGINPLPATRLATAAILPNTPTYANGTAGVGATLTAGSSSALTVDGTLAALNDIILVKTQGSAFQNGIYQLTTAGSVSTAWVLTRVTYFDQAAEMKNNSQTVVTAGATQYGTWTMSPVVTTVGTDPLNWSLSVAGAVASIAGQGGAFTCASELNCTVQTLAFATIAANNVLANFTGSTAKPVANVMPSCPDTGGNHLNYVLATGISCGTTGGGTTYSCPVTTVTTNTTLSAATCQTVLANCTSGCTITLFAAGSGVNGNLVTVKKIDSSANNVTVIVTGAGNIDGGTAIATNTQWGSIALSPNNSQWYTL